MLLVYFSHSYRREDAAIVRYFGELIRSEGLLPVLDPPSESVNAARLQRHLRDSDGMVVVLTQRDTGVSPHILFEATLCLQARKPLLVFVEDVLSVNLLPDRVLKSRFSRKWFFRQVRDHRQSVRLFRSYLGDEPPPRYQPAATKQSCLFIGASALQAHTRDATLDVIDRYGYNVVAEQLNDRDQRQSVMISEHLACADLAVEIVDSRDSFDHYLMGAVRAAFIPRISFTRREDYSYALAIPREYQPRHLSDAPDSVSIDIGAQLTLFEQAFVELDTSEEVTRYVDLLLHASNPRGQYETDTRNIFIEELNMGDQYKVGQAGAVGPNAHAHDLTFQQIWHESAGSIDTAQLARELTELRSVLSKEASEPEQYVALGEVAAAEQAAKAGDGPKALQHLKSAGSWVWDIGTKVGVGVAVAAAKATLGI